MRHIDELRILLADTPVDILSINETRLDDSVKDSDVYIPGYEVIRRDRETNGRFGGGVCFYVRSNITCSLRPDLSIYQLENLCIEIRKPRSRPFLVVTWYRPPDSAVEIFTYFESLIGRIDAENVEFYLMGDLNCNLAAPQLDHNANLLSSIADVYSLQQLITDSTRCTDSSSTLIDLIFTNCPERVVCSGVSHIGISDHSLIYVYRKLSIDPPSRGHTTVTYRKFKNFNSSNFRYDIACQNWQIINNYDDPNDMWDAWKNLFLFCVDKHAPLRNKRIRSCKSPWITSQLKQRFHARDILKLKATRSGDPDDWCKFKKLRNTVNNEIKRAKECYYMHAFSDSRGDSRNTWRIVNELMSRKSHSSVINEIKLPRGNSIYDSHELSDAFNDHFSSIGPRLANDINVNVDSTSHLDYLSTTSDCTFQLKTTSISKVTSLLSKLCKSKSTGLDKISASLLRECADLIAAPLCTIFNQSIVSGIFPDEWKFSKVIPLFKQGERSDLNNYRPISVIPVVAKVFERIIYDQLYDYFTVHKLISSHQSGFRPLHSTVTALLEATDSWAYNIDQGNVNAVVFLDLKKAFDTVDHEILLSKLNKYGVQGTSYEWFKSYLDCRKQRCFVNGSLSGDHFLTCGIPQGTILGPLLFLIYINDLPNCLLNSVPRMYADDTHLTFASNNILNINTVLNEDLARVEKWLIANKLTLNASKTEVMLIGSRQRLSTFHNPLSLIVDGAPISQVSSTKSLGVHIDQNLSWNVHVEKLCKKIASGVGALKRARSFVPYETLRSVYMSLVQPHFDYCDSVWGNCTKALANKLQKLQNRAARILTHSNYDANADFLIQQLGWKKLHSQRSIHMGVMIYKSLNGLAPDYLSAKFLDRSSVCNYSLRDTEGKLAVPMPHTNYMKNSFSYSGAVLWNSLPIELRQANSLTAFRAGCERFFSSNEL